MKHHITLAALLRAPLAALAALILLPTIVQTRTLTLKDADTVRIIEDKQYSEYLLLSSVYDARSEVLLTTSSVKFLEHLCKMGLVKSLKHAIGQGARIIILYPEHRNKELIDIHILNLINDIRDHVQLERISGIMGSVLIVDNSKILLLSGEEKDEGEKAGQRRRKGSRGDGR